MTGFSYKGHELELFQHAVNWKRYYGAHLRPYIAGDVLEVGAGIGGSRHLCAEYQSSWTFLEPDAGMAERLQKLLAAEPLPVRSRVVCGTVGDLATESFDTLLYIDVLEHIEDDRRELAQSALRLRPGGRLIVLTPAHNALFSPFDRAIGHYRRYNRRTLALAARRDLLALIRMFYLDSAGVLASLANRALLGADYPTLSQIRFWDSTLVRTSRVLDRLLQYRVGKTLIAVWERTSSA